MAERSSRKLWKEVSKNIYWELYRELEDSASETRSSLMVVAVLVATVTFQAGINPPGGVWPGNPHENSKNTTHGSKANAVMASNITCYVAFLIYNTTGFLMSLGVAVISMLGTYVWCVCYLALLHRCREVCGLMIVLFFRAIIGWIFWWLKKLAKIIQTRQIMT